MGKSNVDKLKEALEAGDIEAAKVLADKIARAKPKPAKAPASEDSIDRVLAAQPLTPRERPPAVKVSVRCAGTCGREYRVYPSAFVVYHDDNGRPERIYKCDRCMRAGR